jgi:hypothetical protein
MIAMENTAETIIEIIIDWVLCALVVAGTAFFIGYPMWLIAMGRV